MFKNRKRKQSNKLHQISHDCIQLDGYTSTRGNHSNHNLTRPKPKNNQNGWIWWQKLKATEVFGKQATSSKLEHPVFELIRISKTNSRWMQGSQTQRLSGICINLIKISTQTPKTPQCQIRDRRAATGLADFSANKACMEMMAVGKWFRFAGTRS